MKKSIYILGLMTLFASCVKNEPYLSDGAGERSIVFSSPLLHKPSKAMLNTSKYPEDDKFHVWGYRYEASQAGNFPGFPANGTSGGGVSLYMDTDCKMVQTVSLKTFWPCDADGNTVDYYWPKSNNSNHVFLAFLAYSPVGAANVSVNDKCINFTGYEVDNETDLLYSDIVVDKFSSTPGNVDYNGVNLVFRHALSAVRFAVFKAEDAENNDREIRIESIKLLNVNQKGNFAQNSDPQWSSHSSPTTYTIYSKEDDGDDDGKIVTTEVEEIGNTLMVLPHVFANVMTNKPNASSNIPMIEIIYSIKYNGTVQVKDPFYCDLHDVTGNNGMDGNTNDNDVAWEPGKMYTYIISIGQQEMFFAPGVESWIDTGDNNILIE